jgi:hypothetical protein
MTSKTDRRDLGSNSSTGPRGELDQMADNYSSKIDPGVSQFVEDSHGATMTVKDVQVVRR